MTASAIRLRPVRTDDLAWMAEMASDPELIGEHNWSGEPQDPAQVEAELRTEFEQDGLVSQHRGTLIVELHDGTPIGDVSWRTERWGPSVKSVCPAIGIALLPQFHGNGYGTVAQRLLVDYLFEVNPDLHRVQSDTAVDNIAEQKALAKVGFVHEGTVRSAEYRNGAFHNHHLYSILRTEWSS